MSLPKYESLPTRRPWRAVPPGGRWLGDLLDDPLTMETCQARGAYEQLVSTGVLRAQHEECDPDFAVAYKWMEKMAADRLPTTGPGLLWLWARIRRRDLRSNARYARGDVLLRVEIRRTRVLLSHFDEWHSVLNQTIVVTPRAGESEDEWWARTEPLLNAFNERIEAYGGRGRMSSWPADAHDDAQSSWAAVLDHAWWKSTDCVQAVSHELHAGDVVSAVRLAGRPRVR